MSYDFSDLQDRWREASKAASQCASDGSEEPHSALGLFLGSLIEELTEAVEEAGAGKALDDLMEYRNDDRPVPPRQIVLKGRHPVSILNELCQQRGWDGPTFDIHQVGGESHTPVFSGVCVVEAEDLDKTLTARAENGKSKGDLKKELAKQMLLVHFDAKEDY